MCVVIALVQEVEAGTFADDVTLFASPTYSDEGHGLTPAEVVNRWLTAWRAGDLEACARLLPDASVLHASEPKALAGDYRGFEAAAEYVRRKAELSGPSFSWEALDVIEVGPFAVLPFHLNANDREPWWQVAVYRVENGHIAEIWLHEEPEATGQRSS